MSRSHLGSFHPTPLSRILAFMGISLAVHAVLLLGTSIPWLLADDAAASEAPAAAAGDERTATAPASRTERPAATAPASSELPEVPKPGGTATDAYLERVGGDPAPESGDDGVDGLDGLEAFE